MIIRKTFKAAALASVCLLPLVGVAQAADDTGFDLPEAMPNTQELKRISDQPAETNNEVTVGVRGQSSTSAVFGRYNGDFREGGSLIGNFRLSGRDDWRGSDTYFYDLTGSDLKFGPNGSFDMAPNSSVNLRVGNQGTWGLTAGYDAITYVQSDSFKTAYDKNGTLVNGLGRGNSTLIASSRLATDVVGTRRDRGSVGLNYNLGDWLFTSGLMHDHKEGTMEQSLTLGTNVAFLQPINYDTDRFDIAAAFNTKRLQSKIVYTFSNFRDNNSMLVLTPLVNPTTTVPAEYSLPPDNMAHQLAAQIGYNLTDVTRLNANLSYGVQLQNQDFVPQNYPGFSGGGAAAGNNQNSLNGMVQTFFGNFAMTSRPLPKTDFRASYTIDSRQNNTPGQYNVLGDRADSTTVTAYTLRNAVASSWTKQTAQVEAGYKVLDSTKLTVGYIYRDTDRTEAVVNHNSENEGYAKVRTTFSQDLTGSLGYNHSVRTAASPNYARAWQGLISGQLSDCSNGLANGTYCFGVPFYQKGRIEDAVSARMTAMLDTDTSLSFNTKFTNNAYLGQSYGLSQDYKISGGPDLSYRISPDADAHVFYTFERSFRTMRMNPSSTGNPSTNPDWTESTTADTHTLGLGGTWKVAPDVKLISNYLVSYSNSGFDEQGIVTGGAGLPNLESMMHSFSLAGDYEYVPGVTFHLGYQFNYMYMKDWSLWGTAYTSGTNGLLTGEGNPNYSVHSVVSSVSFKW